MEFDSNSIHSGLSVEAVRLLIHNNNNNEEHNIPFFPANHFCLEDYNSFGLTPLRLLLD
jgi:hypothetical protein